MYILPNEAMELLEITTRQGLHKIVVNHNITVKSQGQGKPNLYLKSDLERYTIENKDKIRLKKKHQTLEKAATIKKEKVERKVKNQKLKAEIKKELNLVGEDEPIDNLFDDEDIIKPPKEDLQNPLNEIGQNEFNRIINILTENGTYKEQDRALVLAYSISYQKYIYAVAASAREDDTTSDQFANLKIHPYFLICDKCLTQMTKIASILGLGIRNRIGIQIEEKKKESIFDILNSKESFDD